MRVLVDSNVFYSRTLRDWVGLLYTLRDDPVFQVFWTEDILAEVIYHLRRDHPDWDGARISSVRDKIARTFEVGRVVDFVVDGSYQGTDPHDAHVHAAAIACFAHVVLTCNTDDFGAALERDALPYEVMSPDGFFTLIDDLAPDVVAEAAHDDAKYWFARTGQANPPERLRAAGAPDFAERVRRHLTGV
jgi:predicted nucleic acid-binding protein